MTATTPLYSNTSRDDWLAEVGRLNRIIEALMDRAERVTSIQGSDFAFFQTAIMLEDRVRSRTQDLETSLCDRTRR